MTAECAWVENKIFNTSTSASHQGRLTEHRGTDLPYNGFDDDPLTISELAVRLRRREVSPVEITRDCLERIEQLNPALNAFITVMAESALAEARTAEDEILRGEWRGPLHGIPIALKDLIDTAGIRTTAASALYKHRVPDTRCGGGSAAAAGGRGHPRQE